VLTFVNNELFTKELKEFFVDSAYSKEWSIRIKMFKRAIFII